VNVGDVDAFELLLTALLLEDFAMLEEEGTMTIRLLEDGIITASLEDDRTMIGMDSDDDEVTPAELVTAAVALDVAFGLLAAMICPLG